MGKKIGKYELGVTLGDGAFSKVKLGVDSETGHKWAIKIIDKEKLAKEKLEEQLKREIAILKSLKHEHIVGLREVMQTANHIYLVLEVVTGGELFDRIVQAKRLDEDTARSYFQQLVLAIHYCHQHNIAHRDIKPENLLLDEHNKLKISDFGLSNLQPKDTKALLQTVCGTPNYVSPEVLKEKGYDGFKADAWSCGIVLFVMLAGYLPFDDENMNALFNKIERGDYRMARHFSSGAKDIISKLLVVDPAKRLSIEGCMSHPWFRVNFDPTRVHGRTVADPTADEMNAAVRQCDDDDANATKSPQATELTPAPAASSAASAGGDTIDAFAIVSRLTGGALNPHSDASADLVNARKTIHILHSGDANDAQQALSSLGCSVKQTGSEVRGFYNGAHGLITFGGACRPTTVPGLSLLELKRGRGDALEYQALAKQLCKAFGPKLRSQLPPSTEE